MAAWKSNAHGERRAERVRSSVSLASVLATLQPSSQRTLCFAGKAAGQKAYDTDVLVQIGPMDPFAASNEPPVAVFARAAVCQSWKPGDGHTDGSTVIFQNHSPSGRGVFQKLSPT